MSRTASRDNSSSVSLFPFLAVLLCTMGGLVVLLVAVSHVSRQMAEREKAKAQATAVEAPADAQARAEQLAELNRRSEQLAEQARLAEQAFRDHQLRLAQVEQHVRKLQDEMQLLLAETQELEQDDTQRYDDRAQAERELARLQQLIEDGKQEVARLKQEQEGKQRSYSVVPYKGRSGTRRQPIYIECLADRVVLQPEGVELTPEDFATPLGVGNPLAAALRAAREHLTRDNPDAAFDPDAQPYPLILVRPDGIGAYYRVRDAIAAWDADFGYEMIDADWNLAFAAPDSELATVEVRAIENARLRREALALAAPSAFKGNGASFEIPVGEGDADEPPYDPSFLGGGVAGSSASGSGGGSGRSGAGQDGGAYSQSVPGQPLQGAGLASGGGGQHPQASASGQHSPYSQGAFYGAPSPGASAPGQPGAASASAAGLDPKTNPLARSPGGETGPGQQGLAAGSASGQSAPGGGAGGPQRSSFGAPSAATASASGQGSGGSAASLNAKNRPDDVAVRRGVTVSVFADRLLIGKQPQPLAMPGPTGVHIDEFVQRVRGEIESWGLAGAGMYWRPAIRLDVREGGRQRATEIEQVLKRSGVDVESLRPAVLTTQERSRATR